MILSFQYILLTERTLTVIFPPLYAFSASGSRAGRREKSDPSISSQSSAWPSRVMSPGLNSTCTWISELESQLHSPDSSCDLTPPIETEAKKIRTNRMRCIVSYRLQIYKGSWKNKNEWIGPFLLSLILGWLASSRCPRGGLELPPGSIAFDFSTLSHHIFTSFHFFIFPFFPSWSFPWWQTNKNVTIFPNLGNDILITARNLANTKLESVKDFISPV